MNTLGNRDKQEQGAKEHGDAGGSRDSMPIANAESGVDDMILPRDNDINHATPAPLKQESDNEVDPNAVDWDGPGDPKNPKNWPESTQMLNVALLSLLTIVTYVYLYTQAVE